MTRQWTEDSTRLALRGIPMLNRLSIKDIRIIVGRAFGVHPDRLLGREKVHRVLIPRQVAMALTYWFTDNSFPKIAREYGGLDHTAALRARNKYFPLIERLIEEAA